MPPKNGLLFWYLGVTGTIGNAGTTTLAIQLDTGSKFRWVGIMGGSSLDAATDVRPNNFSVTPSLKSVNQMLSNAVRIPQKMLCGIAENVFWLPNPVFLNAGEIVSCDILNLTASNNIVTIALLGYKEPI